MNKNKIKKLGKEFRKRGKNKRKTTQNFSHISVKINRINSVRMRIGNYLEQISFDLKCQ